MRWILQQQFESIYRGIKRVKMTPVFIKLRLYIYERLKKTRCFATHSQTKSTLITRSSFSISSWLCLSPAFLYGNVWCAHFHMSFLASHSFRAVHLRLDWQFARARAGAGARAHRYSSCSGAALLRSQRGACFLQRLEQPSVKRLEAGALLRTKLWRVLLTVKDIHSFIYSYCDRS